MPPVMTTIRGAIDRVLLARKNARPPDDHDHRRAAAGRRSISVCPAAVRGVVLVVPRRAVAASLAALRRRDLFRRRRAAPARSVIFPMGIVRIAAVVAGVVVVRRSGVVTAVVARLAAGRLAGAEAPRIRLAARVAAGTATSAATVVATRAAATQQCGEVSAAAARAQNHHRQTSQHPASHCSLAPLLACRPRPCATRTDSRVRIGQAWGQNQENPHDPYNRQASGGGWDDGCAVVLAGRSCQIGAQRRMAVAPER